VVDPVLARTGVVGLQRPGGGPAQTAAQQQRHGQGHSSATDYSFAFNVCDAMFVCELALRPRGRSDGPDIAVAVEARVSS